MTRFNGWTDDQKAEADRAARSIVTLMLHDQDADALALVQESDDPRLLAWALAVQLIAVFSIDYINLPDPDPDIEAMRETWKMFTEAREEAEPWV